MPIRFFRNAIRSARRAAAGFTLVEMLVAMVLVSLIMIVALDAFIGTRRVTRKNLSVNEAQQQGSYAMQELAVTLRRTGFQLGPTFAILKIFCSGGSCATAGHIDNIATWDQYPGGTGGTWIWQEPLGTITGYVPVTGTDGISVKYGDDQPPIHVCVMPNGNANNMDMDYDPAYAAYYPKTGDVIDVITTSNCYDSGEEGTNIVTVGVATNSTTPPDQCSNAGGAGGLDCSKSPAGDSCYCKDTLCKALQLSKNCYKVTFDKNVGKPGCDFCEKGPTYIVTSKTASFWISTEDRTGVIYNAAGGVSSRPVLVGRYGGPGTAARIVATDIEDLQISYLLNNPVGTVQDQQTVPASTLLPKTRALRISLSARSGVTDLMYKNYTYCSGKGASFTQLFSRATLENHAANAAANTDYCDGLRRVVYNQVVNLPNMTSYPIGKAPSV
jgi:prepilin-type N-terminal cleavage/methylation domain-containing protein